MSDEYSKYAATRVGSRELAAANYVEEIAHLIREAFVRSQYTIGEFADLMDCSIERAEELLETDGNLKAASIAKIFDVLGWRITASLTTRRSNRAPTTRA